ncbi:MAG: peptide chain release factor 1 [Anaerolineales bacterium]|nr:peptide chain release factor 1 [Anaerolineales bacterium]QYK50901.1 MAG: peptide chain release factor 1 [Anaerolineales bacterium]
MLDKIAGIEARYDEIEKELTQDAGNYQRVAELSKERSELQEIVEKARAYRDALKRQAEAKELAYGNDAEMAELAEMELAELDEQVPRLENEIKSLLLPTDPRDKRNVIVEIRAGAGGDEAGIFAADLYRMYTRFAERQGWKQELLSTSATGVGGYKEVTFLLKAKGAFSRLKHESGVHRVQRVPATEAQGRIHTSTATVAVLAEVDEVEIKIPESDIRMDVYRSAGAGGQNVQKNSTAVRLTHLPTGIVVQCQDERSQLQNRLRAMAILRARLYELEEEKRRSEQEAARRSQVGTGERSEKIRTYNYPQSRVSDHRIGYTSHNLPALMDGDLEELFDELATQDEADRLAAAGM